MFNDLIRDLNLLDVRGSCTTSRFLNIEFYFFANFSGFVVVHDQGRIMEKDIGIFFSMNEAVTFFLIEHFDCSLHEILTFLQRICEQNNSLLYNSINNCFFLMFLHFFHIWSPYFLVTMVMFSKRQIA